MEGTFSQPRVKCGFTPGDWLGGFWPPHLPCWSFVQGTSLVVGCGYP